jgi:excisionase family DNA binding protein
MSEEFFTVEDAAGRLRLHPKTLRRFIREGRLKASRVGKSYLIQRSELDAFAGVRKSSARTIPSARVTGIVDVADVDRQTAGQIANYLTAARMGTEQAAEPMSVEVVHDPARRQLKVLMVGSPADVAAMLKLVEFHLQPQS